MLLQKAKSVLVQVVNELTVAGDFPAAAAFPTAFLTTVVCSSVVLLILCCRSRQHRRCLPLPQQSPADLRARQAERSGSPRTGARPPRRRARPRPRDPPRWGRRAASLPPGAEPRPQKGGKAPEGPTRGLYDARERGVTHKEAQPEVFLASTSAGPGRAGERARTPKTSGKWRRSKSVNRWQKKQRETCDMKAERESVV